jgi:hypothetical protein
MRPSATSQRLVALVPPLLLAACGGRSGVLGDAPFDAAPGATEGGLIADATASVDARDAGVDAGPAPCHLVPAGDPFPTMAFPGQPTWSFFQQGLVLRTMADGTPHVVQFGGVENAGNDGWNDPALYAAEYDVSVWPPRVVQAPTAISLAQQGEAFAVVLSGDRILFSWPLEIDYGGLGPWTILDRKADGIPWQLGNQERLVNNAMNPTAPAVAASGDSFALAYTYQDVGDASTSTELPTLLANDGRISPFTRDGTPTAAPTQFWNAVKGAPWSEVGSALARTRTTNLLATYFPSCNADVESAYCEAGAFVILSAGADGALEKVAALQPQSASDGVAWLDLASDAQGHNWLTWVESAAAAGSTVGPSYLFAVPLTDEGVPAGPMEAWVATSAFPYATNAGSSVGPIGAIEPLALSSTTDAGDRLREVHLVHRPLAPEAPVEDVTFTIAWEVYPPNVVQTVEPRGIVAAYATYPDAGPTSGSLVRFLCAEDSD